MKKGVDTNAELQELRKVPANKKCFDCNQAGTTYAVIDLGVFLCSICGGIHREFNHRVKGLSTCNFSEAEVNKLKSLGNERAQSIWMAKHDSRSIPIPDIKDSKKLKDFLRMKYIDKRFYENKNNGSSVSVEPVKEEKKVEKKEEVKIVKQGSKTFNLLDDDLIGGGEVGGKVNGNLAPAPVQNSFPMFPAFGFGVSNGAVPEVTSNLNSNNVFNAPFSNTPNMVSNIPPNAPQNMTPNIPANMTPNMPSNIPPSISSNIPPNGSSNMFSNVPPNMSSNMPQNISSNMPPNMSSPNMFSNMPPNIPSNPSPNMFPIIHPTMASNPGQNMFSNIPPKASTSNPSNPSLFPFPPPGPNQLSNPQNLQSLNNPNPQSDFSPFDKPPIYNPVPQPQPSNQNPNLFDSFNIFGSSPSQTPPPALQGNINHPIPNPNQGFNLFPNNVPMMPSPNSFNQYAHGNPISNPYANASGPMQSNPSLMYPVNPIPAHGAMMNVNPSKNIGNVSSGLSGFSKSSDPFEQLMEEQLEKGLSNSNNPYANSNQNQLVNKYNMTVESYQRTYGMPFPYSFHEWKNMNPGNPAPEVRQNRENPFDLYG